MKIEFSFDDGDQLDLRVADILEAAGFKGTFYIPSLSNGKTKRSLNNAQVMALAGRGHEIGGHTVSHPPDMKLLNDEQLAREIYDNKANLEKLIGKPLTKFCYPRGRYDERVKTAVKSFLYESARTTEVLNTEFPTDPFAVPTTIHIYPRKEYDGRPWQDVAREQFEIAKSKGQRGRFHLWGHSWEIDRLNEWTPFENFMEWLKIEYAKNF